MVAPWFTDELISDSSAFFLRVHHITVINSHYTRRTEPNAGDRMNTVNAVMALQMQLCSQMH